MARLQNLSKFLMITTLMFEMTTSQAILPRQFITEVISPSPIYSSPMDNTEVLCKDLASAIQNVVVSKMRRNVCKGPIFGTEGTKLDTLGPFGAHGTGCQCQMCKNKWENSLARVLGMPRPVTNGIGLANVPISAIVQSSDPIQDNYATNIVTHPYSNPASNYVPQNMADLMSKLGPLVSKLVPNGGTKYAELVPAQEALRNAVLY